VSSNRLGELAVTFNNAGWRATSDRPIVTPTVRSST